MFQIPEVDKLRLLTADEEIIGEVDIEKLDVTSHSLADPSFSYAWNWFRYHARQRLRAFHFFLIIIGFMVFGYITALTRGMPFFAVLIGVLGALVSLAFLFIEIRNAELVNCGRSALDELEEEMRVSIREDDLARTHLEDAAPLLTNWILDTNERSTEKTDEEVEDGLTARGRELVFTHTFWLRGILVSGLIGFFAAALMGIYLAP